MKVSTVLFLMIQLIVSLSQAASTCEYIAADIKPIAFTADTEEAAYTKAVHKCYEARVAKFEESDSDRGLASAISTREADRDTKVFYAETCVNQVRCRSN